ncbi:PD-(D/E)XK motif protein [Pedobacter hartonius]
MNLSENPWRYMNSQTVRRIDLKTIHNLFWICDDDGRFGMMFHFNHSLPQESFIGQMKGISIATVDNDGTRFYLILHENKDWEMFLAVCCDIVDRVSRVKDEPDMIRIINQRIKRWQRFLSEDRPLSMPEKIQMGLFAELYCILDLIIPAIGYRNAIIGWVGPDSDQKDFSLQECFLEVKSYVSSKGPKIRISSLGQLETDIKPVYLICYALSQGSTGLDIPSLVKAIIDLITPMDIQILGIFEERLTAYGYIEGITQGPFSSYSIDCSKTYKVETDFPRITNDMIDSRISGVKYSLDLVQCEKYEQKLPF